MTDPRVIVSYIDYFAEAGILAYLLAAAVRRRANGLLGITAYMLASVGVGGLRMYAAFRYGPFSHQYALCYWLTDYGMVFASFLLITSFFRRVWTDRPKGWQHVRLTLISIFIVTGAVSYVTIIHRGRSFFPYFVIEFQQDLYFACLVLATALYLMVVKFNDGDDQLGLLVSGLGVAFAGYAATIALYIAAGRSPLYGVLTGYIIPLSDIAMITVWFYVAAYVPQLHVRASEDAQISGRTGPASVLARSEIRL